MTPHWHPSEERRQQYQAQEEAIAKAQEGTWQGPALAEHFGPTEFEKGGRGLHVHRGGFINKAAGFIEEYYEKGSLVKKQKNKNPKP